MPFPGRLRRFLTSDYLPTIAVGCCCAMLLAWFILDRPALKYLAIALAWIYVLWQCLIWIAAGHMRLYLGLLLLAIGIGTALRGILKLGIGTSYTGAAICAIIGIVLLISLKAGKRA